MKTETKIAEENIEFRDSYKDGNTSWRIFNNICKRHKASCQRFLPNRERTLNWLRIFITKFSVRTNVSERMEVEAECRKLDYEITDLKNAIKKYACLSALAEDEAGI